MARGEVGGEVGGEVNLWIDWDFRETSPVTVVPGWFWPGKRPIAGLQISTGENGAADRDRTGMISLEG
jgi:hypothetical protein